MNDAGFEESPRSGVGAALGQMDVFAVDVKDDAGRALGDQLYEQHFGEVAFAGAFDPGDDIDLFQVLTFDLKGFAGECVAEADAMPFVAGGVGKDLGVY